MLDYSAGDGKFKGRGFGRGGDESLKGFVLCFFLGGMELEARGLMIGRCAFFVGREN